LDSSDPGAERIWGGYIGEGAKTVIPSKAYAKFSTRLVPNQNPQKIAGQVEKHIRKLLPKTVTCKFDLLSSGKPWVALTKIPFLPKRKPHCRKASAKKPFLSAKAAPSPSSPRCTIRSTFRASFSVSAFRRNAHAPDEHIALENYFGGIKAIANFYSDLGTS